MKSQPRPRVALPKATSFNESVSIDLKEVKTLIDDPSDKRYIFYLTDEFTRMIRRQVIPNKEMETVVGAILKEWHIKFAGPPKKGYHCDNGKEFVNKELQEICSKEGIKISLSPAYSPWSNGLNERRHCVVDITIKKLLADNGDLSLEDALDIALQVKNNEIHSTLGYSPNQLVYGEGSAVIGITDGDIATDENITQSEALFKHMKRRMEAQETFRKHDSDQRIKKALKSKIPAYNNEVYVPGEYVWFQDENNKWKGPAKVTGQEGRTISFIWQGVRGKTTHVCRIQRFIEESGQNEKESDGLNENPDEMKDDSNEMKDDSNEKSDEPMKEPLDHVKHDSLVSPKRKKSNGIRPMKRAEIKYKTIEDDGDNWVEGYVADVGKENGKYKNTCWVKDKYNNTIKLDFGTEVEDWEYINKDTKVVKFSKEISPENKNDIYLADLIKDREGAGELIKANQVLAVLVPKHRHNEPEVISAKNQELENWSKFEAFTSVPDEGQHTITTRWVINEKEGHNV